MKKGRIYRLFFSKYSVPLWILILILILWEMLVWIFGIPKYLLPGPTQIAVASVKNFSLLINHFQVTLSEVLLGLGLGISAGIILSIFIVCFRTCEIILFPLIIILQTFPKIALAPTLLFWMGPGIVPKIVISALISFFPILVSFTKGLKSLEPDLEDLLTVYQANKKEVFLRARIPGALPDFFAGLKSAVPYSVTGAIAAEFAGAYKGLGYLILGAQASYNTSLVFAAAFFLSCIGVGLFVTVRFIEKRIISWHVSETTKLMW